MLRKSLRRSAAHAVMLLAGFALAACGGAKPYMYGDYASIKPSFVVPANEKPPTHVDVTLGNEEYVTLLYVVPGRGSLVVFPRDSVTSTKLEAGTHAVPTGFPKVPSRDSMLAALRPRIPAGATQAQRDSIRNTRPLPDLSPGTSRFGYLLMFTSPSPINYMDVRHRVEGITIPIDDEPAINTVVKLVRAALPDGATWSAYTKEIDLQ